MVGAFGVGEPTHQGQRGLAKMKIVPKPVPGSGPLGVTRNVDRRQLHLQTLGIECESRFPKRFQGEIKKCSQGLNDNTKCLDPKKACETQ